MLQERRPRVTMDLTSPCSAEMYYLLGTERSLRGHRMLGVPQLTVLQPNMTAKSALRTCNMANLSATFSSETGEL